MPGAACSTSGRCSSFTSTQRASPSPRASAGRWRPRAPCRASSGGQAWEDDCRDLHSDLQRAIADFKAQEARLRAAAGGPRAALDGGPAAGLPPGWHPDDASPSDLVFPCPFPPAAPAEPPHPLEFYPTSRLDLDWGVVEEGGAPAPGVACGPRSREPGTQLFVLLFGVGQADTEGIYSLRSMPKDDGLPLDTIVAFECDDDAQRYACLLEATMDHEPTVWPIEWGDLLEFCNSAGYRLRLEPGGSLLIPPDYNVGMTDWEKSLRLRKGEFAGCLGVAQGSPGNRVCGSSRDRAQQLPARPRLVLLLSGGSPSCSCPHVLDAPGQVELALKVVAFGWRAYISFFTNKLDCVVVVVSTVVLVAQMLNARFLRALRVLRAVRPLRVLTRSTATLMVFHTLVRSLASMGNVTVVCAMVFIIFGILGTQLFAGTMWSCNDTSVAGKADCVGTFADPETGALTVRAWTNQPFNFDNLGHSLLLLFITSTADGFTPAMYMTMSSSRATRDMQPHMGTNPIAFVFWFAFISLATFFVINLYVGVVFYQFTRLQMLSQTGSAVLTSAQTGYVELLKAVFRLRPIDKAPVPINRVRRWCHAAAYSRWFEYSIMGVIAANVALMASTTSSEPPRFTAAKEACNTAFSTIIVGELAIKLAAMGPCMYWRSHWNKFDAALCVTALADLITQLLNAALGGVVNLGAVRRVLMLARILRAFKFVRHVKGIQSLLATLVLSLPAVFNVACLLFLAFFIYSNAGMLLFGNVVWQDSINEHANFSTFPRALFLLYRVSTGDNYVGVMRDCMVRPPDCDSAAGNCGSLAAPLFFFSFYLSVGLIAFQLVITIILDSFEKVVEQEQWQLTTDDLARFCSLWAEYDDGCNRIEPSSLEELLTRLPPPMGLGALATNNDILRFVFSLDIPLDDDGMVPFHRTAFELVQRCTRTQIPEGDLKRRLERMTRRFLTKHAQSQAAQDMEMNVSLALTVMRIQRTWRAKAARRRAEREVADATVAAGNAAASNAPGETSASAGGTGAMGAPGGGEAVVWTSEPLLASPTAQQQPAAERMVPVVPRLPLHMLRMPESER